MAPPLPPCPSGLYSWDEGDGSLKVVAYVHYQHLLPLAQAKIPTPQVRGTGQHLCLDNGNSYGVLTQRESGMLLLQQAVLASVEFVYHLP
jgi:hypothetical protein